MIPSNPDLMAAGVLSTVLKQLTVQYPDGESDDFQFLQVDTGFVSTPTRYPYISVHTGPARGKPARLGRGDEPVAYDVTVECVITIEYEDSMPQRGYERLTTLRWEIWRHLIKHKLYFRAQQMEFVDIEESSLNYLTDDGGFVDWGFSGAVFQPVSVKFRGV